jgi:CheY-like chemotaxis protein
MATILIVDDNEHFLDLACAVVAAQGHECLRAKSKSEALRVISEREPDCCVLDIRLEESLYSEKKPDGVDLFEEIKSLTSNKRVIFTSAHSDFEEGYLQRRGANGLIDKRWFVRDIESALNEVFYPRVLLVEDDDQFAYVASALFDERGVKCILITDSEDMRKQVEQCDFSTFDAVVADALLSKESDDYHGWDVVAHLPDSYSRDSIFFLTGKTKSEIESHLERPVQPTREKLLAGLSRLSEKNVLDKEKLSWTDVIARACEAREGANG